MRSRRPTIRTAALGLAGIAIAGILAGYGVLAWTTKDQPGPVHLPSAAPSSQTSFSQTDPSGKWVIDPEAGSFVGYRAKELLAVDFVASPNDAVGRSTTVDGSIDIEGGKLIKASLTANVADLRSDEDLRDQHLVEGLKLAHDPTASFDSTNAVDLGAIKVGEPVEVDVPGTLTIKGEARPIVAHVDGRWDGGRIALAGSMVIHRADFDLNMDQLVVFRVADDITIEFQLGLVPSCAPSCVAGLPTPAPTPAASPSTSPSESPVPTPSGALASTSGRFAISGLTDRGESAPPVEEIYLVDADGRSLTLLTKQGSM